MTVNISQVLVSEVVGKEIRCERPLFWSQGVIFVDRIKKRWWP